MNNKVQKYREELEKIEVKMTALKERGKVLEQKIREEETLEIYALMRSENLTMSELVALAHSRKEDRSFPYVMDKQTDIAAAEADHEQYAAMGQDTGEKRQAYMDDEDEEDDDYDE